MAAPVPQLGDAPPGDWREADEAIADVEKCKAQLAKAYARRARAFSRLRDAGASVRAIALSYGVNPKVVREAVGDG